MYCLNHEDGIYDIGLQFLLLWRVIFLFKYDYDFSQFVCINIYHSIFAFTTHSLQNTVVIIGLACFNTVPCNEKNQCVWTILHLTFVYLVKIFFLEIWVFDGMCLSVLYLPWSFSKHFHTSIILSSLSRRFTSLIRREGFCDATTSNISLDLEWCSSDWSVETLLSSAKYFQPLAALIDVSKYWQSVPLKEIWLSSIETFES